MNGQNIVVYDHDDKYDTYLVLERVQFGNKLMYKEHPFVKWSDLVNDEKYHFGDQQIEDMVNNAAYNDDPYLATFVIPLKDFFDATLN